MVVLPPSSSLFWKGKEDLDGKRAGGRNYDRRPVASLTDDASLRSRLRAQKDGTTPAGPQMRQPPRGGTWVGSTCDISKFYEMQVLVSLFDRIRVECFHDAALDIEMVSPMPSITRLHTTMHMDLTSFRSSGNIMDSENHTNFTTLHMSMSCSVVNTSILFASHVWS
ncbi:hypothetical protein V1478_016661 [Vespula squamosa]|uniref:Uncharacterized protein n=1 Tax=Vespula squamosa TaxID=30214 RepID=A0ABD2A0E4_VESSQ